VSDLYKAPFRFAGTIKKIDIDLKPEKLGAADLEKLNRADALFRLAE
jgi:hypothetical protein